MHGIIIVKTVLVLLKRAKWDKLSAIDNFVSSNAPKTPDMLTVNQEFHAQDFTIQGKVKRLQSILGTFQSYAE